MEQIMAARMLFKERRFPNRRTKKYGGLESAAP